MPPAKPAYPPPRSLNLADFLNSPSTAIAESLPSSGYNQQNRFQTYTQRYQSQSRGIPSTHPLNCTSPYMLHPNRTPSMLLRFKLKLTVIKARVRWESSRLLSRRILIVFSFFFSVLSGDDLNQRGATLSYVNGQRPRNSNFEPIRPSGRSYSLSRPLTGMLVTALRRLHGIFTGKLEQPPMINLG